MSEALPDRLAALRGALAPQALALAISLRGPESPAALALPPGAAAWAEAALRALAEAALRRAAAAAVGGALELALGLVPAPGGSRLRALAQDELPGLPEPAQAAAFAYLAGDGPPPAADPLHLGAFREAGGLAELDFASSGGGNLLWAELGPLAAAAPGAAGVPLAGWSRRPRLDAADLLRRLGGHAQIAALVIATFRADAPQQLAALAAALPTRPAEAQRLVHGLKGAARNVGGLMLGEVAAAAETALQAGRPALVAAYLPRLRWELAQLESSWAAAAD